MNDDLGRAKRPKIWDEYILKVDPDDDYMTRVAAIERATGKELLDHYFEWTSPWWIRLWMKIFITNRLADEAAKQRKKEKLRKAFGP